jgi:hypothetical protein
MEALAYAGIREEKRRSASAGGGVVLRRRGAGRGGFTLTAASSPAKGKAVAAPAPPAKVDVGAVLKKASASAFRGGLAGFAAGVVQARGAWRARPRRVHAPTRLAASRRLRSAHARARARRDQVGSFMWMRTVMNYQARGPRARRRGAGRRPRVRKPRSR